MTMRAQTRFVTGRRIEPVTQAVTSRGSQDGLLRVSEDAQPAGADLEAVERPVPPPGGHRACDICGESLAGRRRHARHCSGACRAEASRGSRAESARSGAVRFPVEPKGADTDRVRQTVQEDVEAVYGCDAAKAAGLLTSRSSELFLRGMTQFHLRRLGWPAAPDDADDVIAVLRDGLQGS